MLVAFKFTHAGTCLRALLLAVVCTFLPAFAAHACGEDTDCKLGDRTYRIAVPADGEPPKGAIIFAHGYRGTAAGVMRNRSMKRAVTGLGLALVAPKSARQDWDIPNAPRPGKFLEKAYFRDLKAALVERHGIDGDRIMMSGFSAGGMMVWNTACHMGDLFAAYVPIAGTFWYPVPDQCTTLPVSIIHIHGTSDRIVPLKGRPIGPTRQGNVYNALKLAVQTGGFDAWKTVGNGGTQKHPLACQERQATAGGHILRFCLHDGGHTIRSAWLVKAWQALEAKGAFRR